MESSINVFAGVNGSGKSSILGEFIRSQGGDFFNPDSFAKELMAANPSLSLKSAQIQAWQTGRDELERSIASGDKFSFETTLGGETIPRILFFAAKSGTKVSVYYIGLNSVELNIERVAARVERGGHDIPIDKIRQRWDGSILNIVNLLPHLNLLRVYDNSKTVEVGASPEPELLVSITDGHIDGAPLVLFRDDFPEWAQPIAVAAVETLGQRRSIKQNSPMCIAPVK
jgi:predicted ABC-type ATPase